MKWSIMVKLFRSKISLECLTVTIGTQSVHAVRYSKRRKRKRVLEHPIKTMINQRHQVACPTLSLKDPMTSRFM
jgi:hypothetical protein